MKIKPFALERFFAEHEFSAPYLLSCSDAEPLTLSELLSMADAETLSLWQELTLAYTHSSGHPQLILEIANLYEGIQPHQLLEVVPEEGIFISMHALLEAGDHVVVTHPGYQSLYEIAISIGCDVSWWEPRMQSGMDFHLEDLAKVITPQTKLLIVNFPHNPTGALISKQDQTALVNMAREKGITIFSDEMYRYAEIDPLDRLPSIAEIYEKGIALGGLSKSFSLPGLRTGWLVSQDERFIASVKVLKDYTTICASAPSEVLALMALRAKDRILSRNASVYRTNLTVLADFFLKHNDRFRWVNPKAGTVIFPELLAGRNADDFCKQLLDKAGIMLLPSSFLGCDSDHVRIGFGRKDMPAVLDRLDHFLLSL